ncbi:fungal specific transcription factor domain-containing protein [Phlyctema vagabunda]|uniref:Fungal specific transcription factor domain-containing protein n=1 Tax=Phlyctema vagabunda TaxID=108571 RepID=A0ABR4P791_9HELO
MPHLPVTREWVISADKTQEDRTETQQSAGRGVAHTSSYSPASSIRPEIGQASHSPPVSSIPSWTPKTVLSSAQQPYEVICNLDGRTDRIKIMGGSSSQCLMKSLDVYLESASIQPLSHNFQHGMQQAEEMDIPLLGSLPEFPEAACCNTYVSTFFSKIHPLYPIFNVDKMKNSIRQLALLPAPSTVPHEQTPLLVSSYLILSIGADENANGLTDDGTKYLIATASLLGHVVLIPYLHAIQALLLFTLAYRGHNKDGVGWQTLGMAIRIAYTLGLHRNSVNDSSNHSEFGDRSKQHLNTVIWAICCSLEKLMQLESGRPATIHHIECDRMTASDQRIAGRDFLKWHVGLAKHQGLICQHIYGHKPGDRTAQQILSDTARLDSSLLSWAREIPEGFRPGIDLFCSSSDFHIAVFLSIEYYQTIITLHRAALIAPASTFSSEVAKHPFDEAEKLRLLAGEAICVSSARSVARLSIEMSDRNIQSRISSAGPQLLACIVLGISLLKNPKSRIIAADLELLKACVENTADQFSKSGHNARFVKGILSIYQQVRRYISRLKEPEAGYRANPCGTDETTYQQLQIGGSFLETQNTPPLRDTNTGSSNISNGVTVPEQAQSDLNQYGILPHEEVPEINSPIVTNPIPLQFHSESLPFDNLNVQELWDWMGDLSGYRSYEYQGSC